MDGLHVASIIGIVDFGRGEGKVGSRDTYLQHLRWGLLGDA